MYRSKRVEPRYIVGTSESNQGHAGALDEWFGGERLIRVGTEAESGRIVFEFTCGALVWGPSTAFEIHPKGGVELIDGDQEGKAVQ